MPLRSFANFKLIMSCHRKELHWALGHGLCINPSLRTSTAEACQHDISIHNTQHPGKLSLLNFFYNN